jgi:hypothetical protein
MVATPTKNINLAIIPKNSRLINPFQNTSINKNFRKRMEITSESSRSPKTANQTIGLSLFLSVFSFIEQSVNKRVCF